MNYNQQYISNSDVDWNFISLNGVQEFNKDYNNLSNEYYSKDVQSFYNGSISNNAEIKDYVPRESSMILDCDNNPCICIATEDKVNLQELDDFNKVLFEQLYGYEEFGKNSTIIKDIQEYIFPYNGAFYSQDGLLVEPIYGSIFNKKQIKNVSGQVDCSILVKKKRPYKKKGEANSRTMNESNKNAAQKKYLEISAEIDKQNGNHEGWYNNSYENGMNINASNGFERQIKTVKRKSKKKVERKPSESGEI